MNTDQPRFTFYGVHFTQKSWNVLKCPKMSHPCPGLDVLSCILWKSIEASAAKWQLFFYCACRSPAWWRLQNSYEKMCRPMSCKCRPMSPRCRLDVVMENWYHVSCEKCNRKKLNSPQQRLLWFPRIWIPDPQNRRRMSPKVARRRGQDVLLWTM